MSKKRPPLILEHCEIDLEAGVVRAGEASHRLSKTESALLRYLTEHEGEVVSRERLLVDVWGYSPTMVTRTVDNTIGRLRAQVERAPSSPSIILTVPGQGYRFVPPIRTSSPPRLVGRDNELARLQARLAIPGLVVLVGPAGVGKTALADEATRGSGRRCWVDLCHARSADELLSTMADAIGLTLPVRAEAPGALDTALGTSQLVLDAIDRLEPDALTLLGSWAGRRILATSRRRIALRGAELIPVEPLGSADGVALYRLLAERILGCPAPTAGVAELVESLDGLPLAIELAASHAPILGPRDLLGRIADVLLDPRSSDGPLHTALAEAWADLDAEGQRVLGCLGWFAGRFSLEDAEALLADAQVPVWRSLATLAHRSLLVTEREQGHTRYHLLEVVRAFTRQQAETQPGRALHRSWALARGQAKAMSLAGGAAAAHSAELRADLLQALEGASPRETLDLRRALHALLLRTGPAGMVCRNADRMVEIATVVGLTDERLQSLLARADLARQQGRFADALSDLATAEAELPPGEDDVLAEVLRQRSMVLRLRLEPEGSRAAATRAMELARSPATRLACRIAAAWTDYTWLGPAAGLDVLEAAPVGASPSTNSTWSVYRAVLLVELGRDEEARAALAQAAGAPVTATTRAIAGWARAALHLVGGGDPDALDLALTACLDAAWRTEEVYVRLLRVLHAVEQNDLAAGHVEAEALLACAGSFPDAGTILLGSFAEALLSWRAGEADAARRIIARARRDLSDSTRLVHDDPLVAVEALLDGREPPPAVLARSVTARLLARASAFGAPPCLTAVRPMGPGYQQQQ